MTASVCKRLPWIFQRFKAVVVWVEWVLSVVRVARRADIVLCTYVQVEGHNRCSHTYSQIELTALQAATQTVQQITRQTACSRESVTKLISFTQLSFDKDVLT